MWGVYQWAVCAGEESGVYNNRQYVQERSKKGITMGSIQGCIKKSVGRVQDQKWALLLQRKKNGRGLKEVWLESENTYIV